MDQLKGQQLAQAMETRVDTAVGMYDGLLPHWDVINEMIGNNFMRTALVFLTAGFHV